ncbi:MAG: ATP-binding cassette domain-containing protein [Planctomycetota bacterium]|jgi:ABC-2 type transport system ATP-binding protein|nr:ATP-binding cassette domain-containing protein [Planctomycetota bacterium]
MLEHVLRVEGLSKTFGPRTVVNSVSFDVKPGEVFGFLGPNGSGKTTTIRMVQGIIRSDSGSVSIRGSEPKRSALKRVGYLPEQVGLPPKARVLDSIRYLVRLKGLSAAEAESSANELLERVGLQEYRKKKVDTLSRGMRQMAQFVIAIAHQPKFIILDEPFAGLDPLNVQLMKEMLTERQRAGATIMFSTHVMSDVEEMCDRIALISEGNLLLFGHLGEIRRERGVRSVQVRAAGVPDDLRSSHVKALADDTVEYDVTQGQTPEQIFRAYAASGIQVDRFERMMPSLNDIFIEEVSRARNA